MRNRHDESTWVAERATLVTGSVFASSLFAPEERLVTNNAGSIAVGDIDADGNLDLVVGAHAPDHAFRNIGPRGLAVLDDATRPIHRGGRPYGQMIGRSAKEFAPQLPGLGVSARTRW